MKRNYLTATLTFSILSIVASVLASPGLAGGQSAATACGNPPDGYNVIETDERFIVGTSGPDFICAGPSNNIIRAKGKDDIIYAGGGNDVIWSGYGNDTVWAGDGNDLVRAGGGKDAVSAGAGDDKVFGGSGADTIRGEDGNDELTGGEGHDMLDGGAGADKIVGNRGIDRITGGAGNDVGQGGSGPDTLLGGAGDDFLNGGEQDDLLGGGDGNDRLLGGNGKDILTGGNGNDALIGGGNPDVLRGSVGNDILDGGNGLNLALGGPGDDWCKNSDDPTTSCEILDGIDQATPPARIWLFVPSAQSPGLLVGGTSWTPNSEMDITILDAAGVAIADPSVVISDESGYWELVIEADKLADGAIMVGDSEAGREKILDPVLESFDWQSATDDLYISGRAGETLEAQVFFPTEDQLVFVEQITLDAAGMGMSNFSEVDDIGVMQLRRSDEDGDVEIHSNITRDLTKKVGDSITTPSVDGDIIAIPVVDTTTGGAVTDNAE